MLRRQLFGIRAEQLADELERRSGRHSHKMAKSRQRLQQFRSITTQLEEYRALLAEEVASLEEHQQALLRMLTTMTTSVDHLPPSPPSGGESPENDGPFAVEHATLEYYRSMQQQIIQGVMALIGPYLEGNQASHLRSTAKGEEAWPRSRSDGSIGSDEA